MLSVGFNVRHLADPEIRGLTRYTVELLRALSPLEGLRLVLFSDRSPHPRHMDGIRAETVVFEAPGQLAWEFRALPGRLKEKGIDVFHAPADRGLPLVKVCPLVVTVHDSYERTHWRLLMPGNKRRFRYWVHEAANYFLSDAVITVSDWTRRELVSLRVAPDRKLVRVYNGVSSRFNPVARGSDKETVARHGARPPFILYVGGYDPRKNVDALVEGFGRAGLADFMLVIIARKTANFAERLPAWRRLPWFDRIRFLEVEDCELPAFYRSAEFFVNPSLWESFSLPTVEAMACGPPVIASNRNALPEIVADAGLSFDPTEESSLPRTMRLLGRDARLRAALREKGIRRAATFSWENTARQVLSVYGKVAGKQRKWSRHEQSSDGPLGVARSLEQRNVHAGVGS